MNYYVLVPVYKHRGADWWKDAQEEARKLEGIEKREAELQ